MARILILGGARETGAAASALRTAGHAVRLYWSRGAELPDLPVAESLRDGLAWADAVLDTSHVFDGDLRALAAGLAQDMPRARYGRALWQPQAGDRWDTRPDLPSAVAALPAGARVFAATGRDSAELLAHHDGKVFLRQLQCHDDPAPANCTFVFGAGPFAVADEVALLRDYAIDLLLVRNIGGRGSYPKVAAARELGLPVVMITPEAKGFGPALTALDDVCTWAGRL